VAGQLLIGKQVESAVTAGAFSSWSVRESSGRSTTRAAAERMAAAWAAAFAATS
jgi:hypothetical protein